MPYHSSLSQGNDLLRQFFTSMVPSFAPAKEKELADRIGKINRMPGISLQEGLTFNTNKTNPFIPDFNGSGFAPFMFAGGTYPNGMTGGGIGDPDGNGGQGDPGSDGPPGPPSGGGDPDPPEDGPGDAEGWRIGIELLTVKE